MMKPPDQALEFFDLVAAQVLPLRELGNKRGDPSAEQSVDEVAALLVDVVLAPDQRPVEITAPVGRGGQSLLLHEPGQESANRAGRPIAVVVHGGDDLVGAERSLDGPEDLQDFAFRVADLHDVIHMYSIC